LQHEHQDEMFGSCCPQQSGGQALIGAGPATHSTYAKIVRTQFAGGVAVAFEACSAKRCLQPSERSAVCWVRHSCILPLPFSTLAQNF
jgi:hypothetical protein